MMRLTKNKFKSSQTLVKTPDADVQLRHGTKAIGFGQTVAPSDAILK